MYFTKEKVQALSDSMGADISYSEAEKRAKKVYVLSKPDMESLVKYLNRYDLPKATGSFSIQLNSVVLSRKAILLRVSLKDDEVIQVDCYHPDCPKTQEFTLFLKINRDDCYTEKYLLIPMERMGKNELEHTKVINIQRNNAELVETLIIAVLYGIQENIFQKRGKKNYFLNTKELAERLTHIVDVNGYERIVNGKKVQVKGYRRYKP